MPHKDSFNTSTIALNRQYSKNAELRITNAELKDENPHIDAFAVHSAFVIQHSAFLLTISPLLFQRNPQLSPICTAYSQLQPNIVVARFSDLLHSPFNATVELPERSASR
jgi:hypothetical protein